MQGGGVALGQGTGLQGEADIDISICLRCLFISLSGRHSAGSHPLTLGWDSTRLSLLISQWSCHAPHGKQIITAGAVMVLWESALECKACWDSVDHPRLFLSSFFSSLMMAEKAGWKELIIIDKFKCMQIVLTLLYPAQDWLQPSGRLDTNCWSDTFAANKTILVKWISLTP